MKWNQVALSRVPQQWDNNCMIFTSQSHTHYLLIDHLCAESVGPVKHDKNWKSTYSYLYRTKFVLLILFNNSTDAQYRFVSFHYVTHLNIDSKPFHMAGISACLKENTFLFIQLPINNTNTSITLNKHFIYITASLYRFGLLIKLVISVAIVFFSYIFRFKSNVSKHTILNMILNIQETITI